MQGWSCLRPWDKECMMRAAFGVLLMMVATVAPAWAQSGTGVSVSLVGDIARYNGSDDVYGGGSRDGEALGFSLRVDRALGSRWGVELEYVRGGEIENESRVIPLPAVTEEVFRSLSSVVGSFVFGSSLSLVPRAPQITTVARQSTVSTLAWYRQSVGSRTSLVYSGGVAFGISEIDTTYNYSFDPRVLGLSIPPTSTEYTSYTVHPIVGVDARIAMTDHASLVPGVRVLGAQGGILIRPSVGLRWEF
jgi:hypothetical protein